VTFEVRLAEAVYRFVPVGYELVPVECETGEATVGFVQVECETGEARVGFVPVEYTVLP
jgi:hypothetical protein